MELFNDLIHNLLVSKALTPAVRNTDTDSAQIDTLGKRQTMFRFNLGNSADTLSGTNKIQCRVWESDTSGAAHTDPGYAEVVAADVIVDPAKDAGAYPVLVDDPGEDQRGFLVEYKGSKRYLIAAIDFSGTHATGTPVSIDVLQTPNNVPVVQAS